MTPQPMESSEIELILRRFASSKKDAALAKLIDSIFPQTAEDLVAHETSPEDPTEDSKE